MEGTACQQPQCNVCDFLPHHCQLCEKDFCSSHRSRFLHDCLPSIVKPYAAVESSICPGGAGSVKQMFRDVATRHDGTPNHAAKQHFHVTSSAVPTHAKDTRLAHLEAMAANEKASSKQRNIANRTKAMLMKSKAVGPAAIPPEDRFYLALQFAVTGETRYFYFTHTSTIGEMVESICRTNALVAFGVPHPPAGVTLVTETPDSLWTFFDRNGRLGDCFESCETVRVSVLPINQVVENQAMLQSLKVEPVEAARHDPEPLYTLNAVYVKQERVIYLKSTEDPTKAIEFPAVILAVHREDVELYYTVEMFVDGERREKQTDGHHLRKVPDGMPIEPTRVETALPEASKPSGGFSVRIALGNKTTEVHGLYPDTPVADLEAKIRHWGRVDAASKMKIICRGKTVPSSARTIKDTNITPGCKLSVMASVSR